jgi:hypothetical protein
MSDDSEDTSPLSRRSALGRRAEQICMDSYFDTRCCLSSIVSFLSLGGFTKKRQLNVRFLVWGCGSLVQPDNRANSINTGKKQISSIESNHNHQTRCDCARIYNLARASYACILREIRELLFLHCYINRRTHSRVHSIAYINNVLQSTRFISFSANAEQNHMLIQLIK